MIRNSQSKLDTWLHRILIGGLVFIVLLIPFHAFLSVSIGTVTDQALLVKAWKELLLIFLVLIAGIILLRNHRVARGFIYSRLNQVAVAFVALHVLLVILFRHFELTNVAGLAIDTRYVIFFLLVRLGVIVMPDLWKYFAKALVVSGIVVVGFGLLQQYLLPADILSYVGYSRDTISPYLTVDNNPNYIRINSTLRGPNPLGAYILILLTALLAWAIPKWHSWTSHIRVACGVSILACLSVLYATHSRSAWLGLGISVAVLAYLMFATKLRTMHYVIICAVLIVLGGGYTLVKDNAAVQTIVEHKDPNDPVGNDSNVGHAQSLADGTKRVLAEPLGTGIGSTGSASLLGDQPVIIENQYLFVAHEAGWLGLLLFISLQAMILVALYKQRTSWYAGGLLASGIGLVLVGVLLPVFADDTIAYLWWGLAAAAIRKS
jgi:hypothetical protein